MTRETVLAAGRAFLTASLADACTIQHPTGMAENLTTGQGTPTYSTVYSGPCKVGGGDSPAGQDVAGAHLAVLSPVLTVPIDVEGVVEGDVVTITAATNDPELLGRVFRINGPHHKTAATSRRFSCVEVTS